MRKALLVFLTIAIVSCTKLSPKHPPPAKAELSTETPQQRDDRMQWWRDARFGMFIHFGLYAIPAGEWKGTKTGGAGEWIMHDLKIPPDEYAPLAQQFNPTKFNAKQWAEIAKDAGMKYIVITSKHHDGFALFDSKFSDYDVTNTPFKRDIMKELSQATRAEGLTMCWYHSILDWHVPGAQDEAGFPNYEKQLRGQVAELLTNYGPIGVMWFDGEWVKPWNDERGESLYKLCRSIQPDTIVNNRVGKQRAGMGGFTKAGGFTGDYATPEQQIPDTVPSGTDWETCMTMNDTWGFKTQDHNFKSTQTLIRDLIDVASKNGNFLLNVGPKADGTIPQESVDRLHEMGQWMRVNGDAIYGTSGTPMPKLTWGRATTKRNKVYLHLFDPPADRLLPVPIKTRPTRAYWLADDRQSLKFASNPQGLLIDMGNVSLDPNATVMVLEFADGGIEVAETATSAAATTTAAPK